MSKELEEEGLLGPPLAPWCNRFGTSGPVPRSSSAMSEGDDPHLVLVQDIDDEVREPVDQISACAIFVDRPTTGRLLDAVNGGLDLPLEIQAEPRTSVFVELYCPPQLNLRLMENDNGSHFNLASISAKTSAAGRPAALPLLTLRTRLRISASCSGLSS